jgi:hypothetical protein
VDAAALAGATVLDDTGINAEAGIAARAVFAANSAAAGQREMAGKVNPGDVIVEFSANLDPFTNVASGAEYVRVRVESFAIEVWLLQVTKLEGEDFTNTSFRASAVAGPSPTLGSSCGLVPLVICAEPGEPAPYFGYEPGQVKVLKGSSKSKNTLCENDIGDGNFQLGQLGGSGASVVRDNLAGGYEGCATLGKTIDTQPGNAAGPVSQGLNTRFGDYQGGGMSSEDFPPDIITQEPSERIVYEELDDPLDDGTCEIAGGVTGEIKFKGETVTSAADIDFNHQDYQARKALSQYDNAPYPSGNGEDDRRNLPVVIADCAAGVNNGQSNMPIMGFGCFFLLQALPNGNGNSNEIFGEFLADCKSQGNVGPLPNDLPGPHIIQLYNDPDSGDS